MLLWDTPLNCFWVGGAQYLSLSTTYLHNVICSYTLYVWVYMFLAHIVSYHLFSVKLSQIRVGQFLADMTVQFLSKTQFGSNCYKFEILVCKAAYFYQKGMCIDRYQWYVVDKYMQCTDLLGKHPGFCHLKSVYQLPCYQ